MFCPRELGGLEADPVTAILVLEALARIDGSASWTIGILGSSALFAGPYLPAATAQRIYAKRVPPMAGSFLPKGQAEPASEGYRVSGRWPFASGIHQADWIFAGAFVPGQPEPTGPRLVLLPRDQVVVHDNWQVAGLKGTGSCDFSIENVFVPDEMTCPMMDLFLGKAVTGGAARAPCGRGLIPYRIPLGIARHALDEVTTQAIEKGRGFPPSPLVAQRVISVAFQAAGGGALFDANPPQRCFRDVFAAGQHFVVSQTSYRALGQFKLNQPDANPML